MDTRIYIATHKAFQPPVGSPYIPLHVGKSGKPSLGYIGDDTGDSISTKNASYCELTGIYWIWKNISCEVVGLCHYRRYFTREGHILTQAEIEETLKTYDLILGTSSMTPAATVADHYSGMHHASDWNICRQALSLMYPDALDAFDLMAHANLMNLGNMMICRKGLFDNYCSWLFPLLEEIETRTDISSYDTFQARLYGYLAERLLRVWVLTQELRVREETITQIEV
jgi:hypothetical protein